MGATPQPKETIASHDNQPRRNGGWLIPVWGLRNGYDARAAPRCVECRSASEWMRGGHWPENAVGQDWFGARQQPADELSRRIRFAPEASTELFHPTDWQARDVVGLGP